MEWVYEVWILGDRHPDHDDDERRSTHDSLEEAERAKSLAARDGLESWYEVRCVPEGQDVDSGEQSGLEEF